MREQIGDECVSLHIQELKNGKIQFTDSANASRLVREYGRDIRYNTAWKNGSFGMAHWVLDDGGL